MKRLPLRSMLLWPVLATLTVGALALGVYVERSVGRDLIATIDTELTRALTAATTPDPGGPGNDGRGRPPGGRPEEPTSADLGDDPPAADVRLSPVEFRLNADGEPTGQDPDAAVFEPDVLAELAGTTGIFTIDGDPRYRMRTAPGRNGGTAIVALPLDQVDESLSSLRRNLVIGGIGLVAAQAIVVWLIAGVVSRPVTRMSDVAHRIARGELNSDVGPPEGPSETAALATDLASMLTGLRETIELREAAAADATRAKDDMARFIADASHELRTPLTALRGYSDLYQAGMLDEEGLQRAMQRIGGESERLTRLVVDMLQLVRTSEVAEPVDLCAVVSAVGHDLRAAHPDRTIDIHLPEMTGVNGSGQIEGTVTGDPDRLHQAVLNLAANACQHTEQTIPIALTVTTDPNSVTVRVVDRGPGITADQVDRLFLPFTRGDASRSRQSHDGAGLGLALVAQIVHEHGGTVDVEETEGGGATFVVLLPRADLTATERQVTATNL